MSLSIDVRKQSLNIETIYHEGGPKAIHPVRVATASAVIRNPYAGMYQEDLMPFMAALRELGKTLSAELVNALGADQIEVYGKGAIVGVNGELEHGAVWHEAGGWALRAALGEPKAMVPSAKAVAAAGYRLVVPLHYIHASYVRSHYTIGEVGIQDAPRPNEILFALLAGTGGRVHARLGGLSKDAVSVHDGQR